MSVDASRLTIVTYPDPVLRRVAKPIPEVTQEVRDVAALNRGQTLESAVETAHRAILIPQQLLLETGQLDAKVALLDEPPVEAGVASELVA